MAATVDSNKPVQMDPVLTCELRLSSCTSGLKETLTPTGAPSGVAPDEVTMEVINTPTDGSTITMIHDPDDDSTANDTFAVTFNTPAGGALEGAKILVRARYRAQASGGITS